MADAHLYAKFLMDMLRQMLGRINAAMLATRASEREHQRRKATLDVATYMCIGQFVDTIKEREYLTIIFQETNDRLVESCQLFVRLITSRIMGTATVKDIPSPIA